MDIRFILSVIESARLALEAFADDAPIVRKVTDVIGRVTELGRLGLEIDEEVIVPELEKAKANLDAIVEAGGVSRADLDAQLAALDANGAAIDAQLAELRALRGAPD